MIKKINDKNFLVLDIKPYYLLKMFNVLNENKKNPTILKLYGLIDGRINNYNFPIIEAANQRTGHSLSFQRFCDLINPNYSIDDKDFLFSSMYRLEIPLLVSYVSKTIQNSVNDRKTFISSIRNGINKIDGINDIFIGKSLNYSFSNNKNISRLSYNYLMPQSLQKNGSIQRIFHPIQFFPRMGKIKKVDVNYAYIDIIRITQVDIGQSIWSCEFFLDVISKHKKPLEIINFNNLSLLNSKFETKLVKQTKDHQFGAVNYRYYIVANFDFFAIADNYPFDWQHIYISMSISDQDKFGLLQPIPEALLDKEFQLDGWRLEDAKTGVLRKKEMHHQNANLEQVVEVREEIRVGWTIARTNVVTTMKVVIPIIFLMFLNYYTFFLPFDSVSTSIGILTTTFLSGIALYFSTEKPQPLRITTIDLIFIYYYLQVGLSVIVTAVTGFTNEILFNYSMVAMKFILPLSILTALFLLFYRIKSVRLRPRIDA